MKICFFTVSLKTKITGIDMVAVDLANELVRRGHEVVFVTHPGQGHTTNIELSPNIKVYEVHKNLSDKNIRLLRSILLKERPDVALPMISNSIVALFVSALRGLNISLVISEHNNPDSYLRHWWNIGQNLDQKYEVRAALFSAADKIHLLNESFKQTLPEFLRDRVKVIKNVCPIPKERRAQKPLLDRAKVILSVGRLEEKQKNLSVLLRSFSQVHKVFPEWKLKIVGDGPSKTMYANMCEQLGIAADVQFVGNSSTPEAHYSDAQIFAIPSKFEGCPLTLVEAQAFAMPSIGLSECSGVNEMIEHRSSGVLAESESDFTFELMALVESAETRQQYSNRAMELAKRYAEEKIYSEWEGLLLEATESKENTAISLVPGRDEKVEANVMLSKLLDRNIYWRFYPRRNVGIPVSTYNKVLNSTSWRITKPIRLFKMGINLLLKGEVRQFLLASKQLVERHYQGTRSALIKRLGKLLPKIDLVGVNVPNMTDIQDVIPKLVLPQNIIKSTTNSFFDELKISRAKIIISAVGAVKRELSNNAKRIEIWHAAGAIKFFSNRTYKGMTEEHLILAPSEYMCEEYAKAFSASIKNVLPLGAPKTDVCFDKSALEKKRESFYQSYPDLKNKKLYFYAPTYRGKWPDDVELYLDLDFEEVVSKLDANEMIITKLHPALRVDSKGRSVRKTNVPERLDGLIDLPEVDTITLLAVADVVISDYSSIIFETVLLGKPLVCYAEDIERYDLERGLAFDYRELMPGTLLESADADSFLRVLRFARVESEKYEAFRQQFLANCDGRAVARLTKIVNRMLDSDDRNSAFDSESIMSST